MNQSDQIRETRLVEYSKRLSQNMTLSEKILWVVLRRDQLGVEFKRQEPILFWIADFWCASHQLVVELDGAYHRGYEQKRKDRVRDFAMRRRGITVLRIPSRLIFDNLNSAIDLICKEIGATRAGEARSEIVTARKLVLDALSGVSDRNVPLLASQAASQLLLAQSRDYGEKEIQTAAGLIRRIARILVQTAGILRRATRRG